MLALDHRGSFKKFINKKEPELVSDEEVVEVKREIISSLKEEFSGVLIDPKWGLPAYREKNKPYLLCAEKTGYAETEGERITEIEYQAEELKKMGASGVKLLVYFNPEAKTNERQLRTAKKVLADVKENELPFFLEIVTYGNEELGRTRKEWVLKSLQMFLDFGIRPDVFKLEYPDDKQGCEEITYILKDIPWILLTRGVSFEVFKEQLKDAVQSGARGFLAGRALWQEIVDCKTEKERKVFLDNIVVERFKEIYKIVLN